MTFREYLAANLLTPADMIARGILVRTLFRALDDDLGLKAAKKIAKLCRRNVTTLFPKSVARWRKRMKTGKQNKQKQP
jgi:hypothetical protein